MIFLGTAPRAHSRRLRPLQPTAATKHMSLDLFPGAAASIAVALLVTCGSATPTAAQNPAHMSCAELWYARNEIYARNGFCFKTRRAQAVFGRGCFPPYGELKRWERNRVNELQMWESRNGC
jgi:hypothetical protein